MRSSVFGMFFMIGLIIGAILTGCDQMHPESDYIIKSKEVDVHNPSFSKYHYNVGMEYYIAIDSTHKYNIGDDIRKYKSK